jgi:hypothetical protein
MEQHLELNPSLFHEPHYLESKIPNPEKIDFYSHKWPMRNAILSSLALRPKLASSVVFKGGLTFEQARCSHCTEMWNFLHEGKREIAINRFLDTFNHSTVDTADWIHFKLAADSCGFKPWTLNPEDNSQKVTLFELIALYGTPALQSGMLQLLYHFYWDVRILKHLLLPSNSQNSLLLVAASSEKDSSQIVAQLLQPLFFLKWIGVKEGQKQFLQAAFKSVSLALDSGSVGGVPKGLSTLVLALMGSKAYLTAIKPIISDPAFPKATWEWLAQNKVAFVDDGQSSKRVAVVGVGVSLAILLSAFISICLWKWIDGKRVQSKEPLDAPIPEPESEPGCENECLLLYS